MSLTSPIKIDIPGVGSIESNDLYLKDEVDAAVAELKAENRKLKRALWLARAERALAERRRYCAMAAFENIENDALRIKWCKIQQECLKKAEEYK